MRQDIPRNSFSEKMIPRTPARRKCCLWGSIAAVILILIVIIVPSAVVLSRKHRSSKPAKILLPLYIYPTDNSSWNPLYNSIERQPDLNFTVIVNPSSGPGDADVPNEDYTTAIEKLNSYANVLTVGYIPTNYAERNISAVLAAIATYAGWASNSSSLAMHGIFFDEAPHTYSSSAVEYMRNVSQTVKESLGLREPRTVIHNPGTIPDARFNDTNTDITVIFESSYDDWAGVREEAVSRLPGSMRENYSIMVHSVPVGDSTSKLKSYVDDLSEYAEWLFVTSNTEDYYESFGIDWADFVAGVPA